MLLTQNVICKLIGLRKVVVDFTTGRLRYRPRLIYARLITSNLAFEIGHTSTDGVWSCAVRSAIRR